MKLQFKKSTHSVSKFKKKLKFFFVCVLKKISAEVYNITGNLFVLPIKGANQMWPHILQICHDALLQLLNRQANIKVKNGVCAIKSYYREVVIVKLMKYMCLLYKIRKLKWFEYIHGWYAEKERELVGTPECQNGS